jgi:hypothetical protein
MSAKHSQKGKNTNRDLILDVYFTRKNYRGAIALLKTERKYGQAKAILPKLGLQNMLPDLRRAITGTITTTNWDEVCISSILPKSQDWLQELGWLAHGFCIEASRLNSFLKERKAFGRSYLIGDFESATQTLAAITKNHGLSLKDH